MHISLPRLSSCLPFALCLSALPAQVDTSLLQSIKARSIGPAGMSGRVVAIDAVVADPRIVYIGAATGGLWKSTDGGLTTRPIFDDQPVASIGAIAIYQPSPDVVWVGTGEGNPRNSVSLGNGVYRSLDGGKSWAHLGLDKTERIRRIWVDPTDRDHALVAALGTAWGENEQRGLFETKDGGKTWNKILYVDQKTGCIDIEVDPGNPKKMFASMWEFRRWPYHFTSGGKSSGLYRSLDGGVTWKKLGAEEGLPKGELGRIKLCFAPSNPAVAYCLVEAKKNVLLRSDDGGHRFRTVNKSNNIAPRPFYYCDLRVDPKDEDRVYNIHSLVDVSDDGGKSFKTLIGWGAAHPDHHAMWIDPNNPELIYDGNDGGVAISRNRGRTWDFVTQLPLAQFYHVNVDMDVPYNVLGGLQDNGSWRGPNTVWENGGIRNQHWHEVCFGDGFATLADPEDSMRGYAMSQEGNLVRWDLRTGRRTFIQPVAEQEGVKLRFNWNAAIAQDPFDAGTIYYGSQFVHKTTDRGDSWQTISPDLTTDNKEWQKQASSGGLTLDVTGAENYTSLLTIAPSAVQRGVIWAGSDDGRVHVTTDGGKSWASVEKNIPGLPANTWCPHIEVCKFDAKTAFAVFDDHRRNNLTPYVFVTRDLGETWQSLAKDNIRGYCLVLEQDPVDKDLLFLGTEFGLWFSCDGGAHWQQFKNGFPTCSAMALVVHPRDHDLVIGTHGRAVWIVDDIRPLRGMGKELQAKALHLHPVPPAYQHATKQTAGSRFPGHGEFRGQTRPRGMMISFSAHQKGLKHPDAKQQKTIEAAAQKKQSPEQAEAAVRKEAEAKKKAEEGETEKGESGPKPGKARLEILDGETVIRRFDVDCKLGLNRVQWNMRRDGAPRFSRNAKAPKPDAPKPSGRAVLPGTYTLRVTVGKHSVTGPIEVRPDPREEYSEADARALDALMARAEELGARAFAVAVRLNEIKAEHGAVQAKLGRLDKEAKPEDLVKASKELDKAIKDFEQAVWGKSGQQGIVRRRGLATEMSRGMRLGGGWKAPTPAQQLRFARSALAVGKLVKKMNALLEGPVEAFNQAVKSNPLDFRLDSEPIK